MVLGDLDSYMQKNESQPPTYTIQKINSRWIKDLNMSQHYKSSKDEHREENFRYSTQQNFH